VGTQTMLQTVIRESNTQKLPPIHTQAHIHTFTRKHAVFACSCLGNTDKLKCYKKANEVKTRFTNQANSFYDVHCSFSYYFSLLFLLFISCYLREEHRNKQK